MGDYGNVREEKQEGTGPHCGGPLTSELQTAEATPAFVAFVVVDYLPVRSEGDLRLRAPKRAIVAVLDGGVPLRRNEHAFPAEIRAPVVINSR
jgi:hypothetical protein